MLVRGGEPHRAGDDRVGWCGWVRKRVEGLFVRAVGWAVIMCVGGEGVYANGWHGECLHVRAE